MDQWHPAMVAALSAPVPQPDAQRTADELQREQERAQQAQYERALTDQQQQLHAQGLL